MFKVVLLLKKREGLSLAEFARDWQAEIRKAASSQLTGYIHNISNALDVPIENAPPARFDAADELWFNEPGSAHAFFVSPSCAGFWASRHEEYLAERPQYVCGYSQVLWAGSATAGPDNVKIVTLPVRREGLTQEAFCDYWLNVHIRLALEGPGTKQRLAKLEACPNGGEPLNSFEAAPFDGAGSIEFSSLQVMQQEFSGNYYREVMAPDEPRFTNPARSCVLMTKPVVIA